MLSSNIGNHRLYQVRASASKMTRDVGAFLIKWGCSDNLCLKYHQLIRLK